ncbi:MAG: response regulator [Paenibacillus sp.]|uniref:helix-turn-helix domain-containing protein n=1 Tax=Paenibacillus sp. TaxID=58172 RepID=UPI0029100695|nr:helix-turn-helix domain-containing protein [Paenibacillus sp.]MDU4694738.1 response regulator [Paenibacillus sp.]
MYKVLIIDDDVPMLQYLEKLIDWSATKIEIVGKCFSSEIALSIFQETQPDIVVTDIGLPIIDGIQLAWTFREMKPDVRIIFLTCFEEIHYLKQAFQLEANDYLIKDELTGQKLADSIEKALKWIKARETSQERLALKQDIQRNKVILKEQFLDAVFKGNSLLDTRKFGERLGVQLTHPGFRLALLYLDGRSMLDIYEIKDYALLQYAVYNIVEETLTDKEKITPFLYRNEGVYLLCNVVPLSGEERAQQDAFLSFIQDVTMSVERYLKMKLWVYYSSETVEFDSLGVSYRQISRTMEQAYYFRHESVQASNGDVSFRSMEPGEFDKELDVVQQAFKKENPQLIDLALSNIRKKATEHRLLPSLVKETFETAVRSAVLETHIPVVENFYPLLRNSAHIEETEQLAKSALKRHLQLALNSEPGKVNDPELEKINQYIDDHVCETVTNVNIADYLHLNPSYFSRFFKKRYGKNFTDYVHLYKMELAKNLLNNPNETMENVAYSLGYSDRAYFSKVFKKYVGTSPSDYKQKKNYERLLD